jgi:hypothetical protein
MNYEKGGETCYSPRRVLRHQKAHCFEGALFAAAVLAFHGQKPLLMNLKAGPGDDHHALALFRRNGLWGAISKTNHAVLRYRDPVYRTPRELALSYFHEYFLQRSGRKTMRAYSKPFNLLRFGTDWITSEEDLWKIADALQDSPHIEILPQKDRRYLRPASVIERKAGKLTQWPA